MRWANSLQDSFGATIRMDTTQPVIYLIFSGHDHNEGRQKVYNTLTTRNIKASFFFTGEFYRNPDNQAFIQDLIRGGHYLGAHSDRHLLYADWSKRDSTLVSRDSFRMDLQSNYDTMSRLFGIKKKNARVFLPPYEWYNQDIADWVRELDLTLINLTPGPGTARDYTWPQMGKRYTSTRQIIADLMAYEEAHKLNGAILLIHPGTDERRTDKLYDHLGDILDDLAEKGYRFRSF